MEEFMVALMGGIVAVVIVCLFVAANRNDDSAYKEKVCHQAGYHYWEERSQCVQYIHPKVKVTIKTPAP